MRSESWPGWPLEVNKVFAVAMRSYVIAKVKEAKTSKKLYHIKNNSSHQTYKGHTFMKRNSALLKKAVDQTKGMFLAYENKPIIAMFDSCCGGVETTLIEGKVDFKKAPYLARKKICTYCKKCSLYNWEACYDLLQLEDKLSSFDPEIKYMKSICVTKKDQAGVVKEITIECAKKTCKIAGEKLYALLKNVKSFCFDIEKKGENVVLKGRGYGHHLGLCQWGARQMVRELWDYKSILQFYYPGTTLMQLT